MINLLRKLKWFLFAEKIVGIRYTDDTVLYAIRRRCGLFYLWKEYLEISDAYGNLCNSQKWYPRPSTMMTYCQTPTLSKIQKVLEDRAQRKKGPIEYVLYTHHFVAARVKGEIDHVGGNVGSSKGSGKPRSATR